GDAQAAAAVPGAGADATVGVGEDGRNPDGRHAPADHRWAHGPAVALHRARTGPVDPAPPVEDRLARSAVTQDCLGRRCRAMTPPCVVPTFRPYAAENLEFGGFYASSCESRVKLVFRILPYRPTSNFALSGKREVSSDGQVSDQYLALRLRAQQ